MEFLIKTGARIVLIVSILGLILSWSPVNAVLTDIIGAQGNIHIQAFINNCGNAFITARKLINNFLPSQLVTVVIIGTAIKKPIELCYNVFRTITQTVG